MERFAIAGDSHTYETRIDWSIPRRGYHLGRNWLRHFRDSYLPFLRPAFENTKNGEALNVVLRRFGAPSHIDGLHDVPGKEGHLVSGCGESCTLRLWYELRFMLGTHALTVDFDSRHKVINKYEMYSP